MAYLRVGLRVCQWAAVTQGSSNGGAAVLAWALAMTLVAAVLAAAVGSAAVGGRRVAELEPSIGLRD
ncbi:MAG: hypothetical protein OEM63_09860 [Gammaproteobacteria bacterium]|nr:hypothetical protein [Gammaproteobacteria bacterium]